MAYDSIILIDSPLVYLRMGEASGDFADSSGNGLDFTATSSVTYGVTPPLVGESDDAITVDQSGGATFDAGGGGIGTAFESFTLEMWLKTTATSAGTIAQLFSNDPGDIVVRHNQSGAITGTTGYLYVESTEPSSTFIRGATTNATNFNDGEWHHVVFQVSSAAGTVAIYIDGVSQGITYHGGNATFTPANNKRFVSIARTYNPGSWLSGSIDEVAIYDYILPEDRVIAHYTAGLGVFERSAHRFSQIGIAARMFPGVTFDLPPWQRDAYVLSLIRPTLYRQFFNQDRGAHRLYNTFTGQSRGAHASLIQLSATDRGASVYVNTFTNTDRGVHRLFNRFTGLSRGAHAVTIQITDVDRGMHRIANDADEQYEIYKGEDAQPDFTAAPWDTFTSLPYTSAAITAPGAGQTKTVNLVVRKRNKWGLLSQNVNAWTIIIDENGNLVTPPSDPDNTAIAAAAGGAVKITSEYEYEQDAASVRADTFAIWLTTDGSTPDPDSDPVTREETMVFADGIAKLSWTSGTFSDGLTAKAIVRTRRSATPDVDSTNNNVVTATTDTDGPGDLVNIGAHLLPVAEQQQ